MADGTAKRRSALGGLGWGGLAVTTVVGVAVGLGSSFTGIPIWLALPVVMIVVFVVTFRARMRGVVAVPDGEVLCARCATNPRLETGFCGPCLAALEASPVPQDHPARGFIGSLAGGDFEALAPLVAPKLTFTFADGRTVVMSKSTWLRSTRFNLWLYRERTGMLFGLYLDPANADNVWARTQDLGKGRLGFPDLETHLVSRYRLPHDLVVEVEVYPALPKSI